MATGGIIKPAKPPPSTLPRKPSFVPPLTSTISAAASRDSNGATAVESSEKGRDPGRMNAASLKRTLEAVSAVESYLANSGRIDFQASNEGEGAFLFRQPQTYTSSRGLAVVQEHQHCA